MKIFTKRNFKRLFIGWLVLNLVLLVIYWPLVKQLARFSPVILPTYYSSPADLAESQAQDIQHLARILKYDRSFSDREKNTFTNHLATMANIAGDMSEAEFYLNVSKAMAITENGHTGVSIRPAFRDFNRAGTDFIWFSDGLHIVRAHKTRAELIGARLIAIEGRTPEMLTEALGAYIGGAPSWKRLQSLYFLRSPELMHAAGLAASPDLLQIKIVDANGVEREVTLNALPAAKDAASYYRRSLVGLSPNALPDEAGEWERALNLEGENLPLYLRSLDKNFLREDLGNGTYLRASILFNRDGMSITEKLAAVLADAPDGGYEFLVVDLRWSPGGDFGTVADFAKSVNSVMSADGKIYVITGPQTFSAAIVSAALFKRFAPNQTLIVGEPMGDYAQFWAERGMSFKLPNSGYYINYATGYHDWEKGCTGTHPYCFPRNAAHDGATVSLTPEMVIAPNYQDYAAGHDVVMDWVLNDEGYTE